MNSPLLLVIPEEKDLLSNFLVKICGFLNHLITGQSCVHTIETLSTVLFMQK